MQYPQYPYLDVTTKTENSPVSFPAQEQIRQPGIEAIMEPRPIYENPLYQGSKRLFNKKALITGGDSGIGRAVAVIYAKEGADVAILYYDETEDALETKQLVENLSRRCFLIPGDLKDENFCQETVSQAYRALGALDIVINNAAVQFPKNSLADISSEQLEITFRTNFFSSFYISKAALPFMKPNSAIINTASITAFAGHKQLIDYSATKGAIVAFTRSLALSLIDQEIRVNAVAPGPVWTPLIPSSFPAEHVMHFGTSNPMKRAAQPFEIAPLYVYLGCDESRYVTGETFHVNGGEYLS